MIVERLQLIRIRTYDRVEVEIPPGFTVFYGPNGAGKTTLLEALYYLMTLKSFRASRDQDLLKTGQDEAAMEAHWTQPTHQARVEFSGRSKRRLLDEKKVSTSSQYCRHFSVVALCPEHQGILSGPPEERRQYLDRVLFGQEAAFLDHAQRYRRALKQKQALLRQEISLPRYLDLVAPWNQEILRLGTLIRDARRAMVATLDPKLRAHHERLSLEGDVQLTYETSAEDLADELERGSQEEHRAQRTLFGPHRDDLRITLKGRKAAEIASQGERASILLALKLSEIEMAEQGNRGKPILLLDDLGATLDAQRRERLLAYLRAGSHQTLITTTEASLVAALRESGATTMELKNPSSERGISFARWLPA